jgi:hypothetical protein
MDLRYFYIPDVDKIIDEQLMGYREDRSCSAFVVSKPEQYGLTVVRACKAGTRYARNESSS